MNFKHVLLFMVLFLFPFVGCKKDALLEQKESLGNPNSNTGGLFNFTNSYSENYCYIPLELNEDLIEVQTGLTLKEAKHPGINGTISEAFGTALWDAYIDADISEDDGTPIGHLTILPYVKSKADRVNALAVIFKEASGQPVMGIMEEKDMVALLNSPIALPEETIAAEEVLEMFASFNIYIFCSEDELINEVTGRCIPCWGSIPDRLDRFFHDVRDWWKLITSGGGNGGGGGSSTGNFNPYIGGIMSNSPSGGNTNTGGGSGGTIIQNPVDLCGLPAEIGFEEIGYAFDQLVKFYIAQGLEGTHGLGTLMANLQSGCLDLPAEQMEGCIRTSIACGIADLIGPSITDEEYFCIQQLPFESSIGLLEYLDNNVAANNSALVRLSCNGIYLSPTNLDCIGTNTDLLNHLIGVTNDVDLIDPCNIEKSKSDLINETLASICTESNGAPTIEDFQEQFPNHIEVTEAFKNCGPLECILNNIISQENSLFCNSIDNFFNDLLTSLKFDVSEHVGPNVYFFNNSADDNGNEASAATSPNPDGKNLSIVFNPDRCDDGHNTQSFVRDLLHEAIHAKMYYDCWPAGVPWGEYIEGFGACALYYYESELGNVPVNEHHIVMAEKFVERLAKGIQNFFGSGTYEDYMYLAWKGLNQYPSYANEQWFIDMLQTLKVRYEIHLPNIVDPCN